MGQRHIIIAEDNSDTRAMVKWLLEQEGYRVETAPDGVAALNMILQKTSDLPDLIVTDIQMPNLSGIDLIKRIRQNNPTAQTPVVAMSAYGREELERATAAGADVILRKPEDLPKLAATVRNLLTT